jgi:TP901 family phage tail tape measure protein
MPGIVDTLLFRFIGSTSHLTTNVASAKKAVGALAARIFTAKGIMVGALTAIGVSAVIAWRKSVAAMAGLDAGLREVATLLPGTVEGLNAVRDALIDLSARAGQPPEMLAEAFYQSVSAGYTNMADSIILVEQASQAAIGGLTDTATALDGITTVLNAYGLSANEATRVSDVMFSTVAEGKIRFGELSSNIGTVASTASVMNISFEETGAAIAALTKNTGQVEESFTALNRFLLGFAKNTDEAQEFAKALGIELTAKRIRDEGLLPLLEDINEAIGGNVDAFVKLNPNLRQFKGAVILAGEGLDDYKKALERNLIALGATQTAVNKINAGIDRQKQILRRTLNKAWLNLGKVTLPIAAKAYKDINRFLVRTFDKEEARIQLLREIGDTEAANALIKIQLEREFQDELDNTFDRQRKILREQIFRLGELAGQQQLQQAVGFVGRGLAAALDFVSDENSPFNAVIDSIREWDAATGELLGEYTRTRDELIAIAKLTDEELKTAEAQARIQNLILVLRADMKDATENEVLDILEIITGLQTLLVIEEDRKNIAEALATLTGQTLEEFVAWRDALGDIEDSDALDELKRKLEEASDVVNEFGRRLDALREFGFGFEDEVAFGDRIPGIVDEYIDKLFDVEDRLVEMRAAYEELKAQGSDLADEALEYVEHLETAVQWLIENRDAIQDAIVYVDELGESIVAVFTSLSDSNRVFVRAILQSFLDALEAAKAAREEAEALDEGTEARAEADERAAKATAKAEKAYKTITAALRTFIKDQGVLEAALDDVEKAWNAFFKDPEDPDAPESRLEAIGELLEASARAALQFADALGVLDDSTRQVLQGLVDLGSGLADIASGNLIPGVIKGIGGVVGVIGGLFGGGGQELSPEQKEAIEEQKRFLKEQRDAIIENSRRLEELTAGIENLTQDLSSIGGELVGGLQTIFRDAEAAYAEALDRLAERAASGVGAGPFEQQALAAAAQAARRQILSDIAAGLDEFGFSILELERVAEEAGIEIGALIAWLEGEKIATEQAIRQAEQFIDALNRFAFEDLFEGFRGQLRLIDLEFQLLDKDDPVERLQRATQAFNELADLPPEFQKRLDDIDFENLTPEELKDLEDILADLFFAVLEDPNLIGALGDLSADDFIEAISELTDSVDELQEEGLGIDSGAENVSAINRITVEQADRLLALTSTQNFYLRSIFEEMVNIRALIEPAFLGLSPPTTGQVEAFTGQVQPGTDTVIENMEVAITVNEAISAQATAEAVVNEFDAMLGQTVIRQDAQTGKVHRRDI